MSDSSDRPTVVTAIVTSDLGVLLCKRLDGSPPWSFPGGEVEPGEEWPDTAMRECAEETGLTVRVGHALGDRMHPKSGRHMAYLACEADPGDTRIKVGDPEEHSEVRWVSWAEAQELMPQIYEPVWLHLDAHLGDGERD